jgi:hypothetical protein
MIVVPAQLLADTFAIFRDCGGGRRECVAYWLGPAGTPDKVDEVIHPQHTSMASGYQIDDQWLTTFWFALARRRRSVRVQVHTHPDKAFHSPTDDAWALVHTPGFLSLVIPQYGLGPIGLDGAYLAERVDREWQEVSVPTRFDIHSGRY